MYILRNDLFLYFEDINNSLLNSVILLVEAHVALQYVLNRSKQPLETVSVKGYYLELSHGHDVSSSWLVLDQGSLSKIVSRAVLEYLNRGFAWL